MNDKLFFIMPAELAKAENGEWKVKGLASTEHKDQQGEIIIQKGMDLTPIDKKQGYFNFDHQPGIENIVGAIDGYSKTPAGLYVEGRLFKNHTKAKALHEIMSSLGESDRGRVGLSVEGRIIERDPYNPKIIKKCEIKNVAITLNPVNSDTYADLMKSLTHSEMDFKADENGEGSELIGKSEEQPMFTASQVMNLLEKTLGVGAGAATEAPPARSGGDALAQEDLEKEPKKVLDIKPIKKGKLKKMSKELYKSSMVEVLDKIQKLYPQCSRIQLWETVKDRLNTKFPELNQTK